MKKVYLENGQEAIFHKKISDNEFIVSPIYIHSYEAFSDEETDEHYEIEGDKKIVDRIFEAPPLPKLQKEFEDLSNKLHEAQENFENLQHDLRVKQSELSRIEQQTTNLNKLIVNRSEFLNAKRITFFPESRILPIIHDVKSKYGIRISIELKIVSGEERSWGTKFEIDEYDGCSEFVDSNYGFLFDKTDDEIAQLAKERATLKQSQFRDWVIEKTPDKYLPEPLIEKKNKLAEATRKKYKEKIEHEINNLKSRLEKLAD